ncbi:head GIN domain-containing protein [Aquimarina mytili]|uniref:DUF2807 domain-containing protein n=1 Tax=Aquimarina mytili TaxID=874423 RepID=A0A937D6R6_9FLAO|nr:head GIN domain-containing protein [Aquimarina mytili]MBL0684714.1 DUF2807 domain-containing protein [Aquimarina mytili]
MRKYIFLLLTLCVYAGQGQDIISKDLDDFTALKIFNKIQVELIQSDENKVEISGIKKRNVNIIQKNNLVKISMSLDNIWDNNNTKVVVYYIQLNKIDVNEGSIVVANDNIVSNSLDLRAQEGASIEAQIETERLFVKSISGGEIKVDGLVKEQEVVITSGGQYYGKDLKTKHTQVTISAGGTAEVHATEYIKANTNAGGTIKIYGNPKTADTQKLLGGKIIEVN